MTTRSAIAIVMIVAVLISPCAFAQNTPPGEPANDAERALIEAQPNAWAQLNPQQRQRVLENFRQWQRMTPEQHQRAERNFQEFRKLPPEERQQVLRTLHQWRQLPPERREQLRAAYTRFKNKIGRAHV